MTIKASKTDLSPDEQNAAALVGGADILEKLYQDVRQAFSPDKEGHRTADHLSVKEPTVQIMTMTYHVLRKLKICIEGKNDIHLLTSVMRAKMEKDGVPLTSEI